MCAPDNKTDRKDRRTSVRINAATNRISRGVRIKRIANTIRPDPAVRTDRNNKRIATETRSEAETGIEGRNKMKL